MQAPGEKGQLSPRWIKDFTFPTFSPKAVNYIGYGRSSDSLPLCKAFPFAWKQTVAKFLQGFNKFIVFNLLKKVTAAGTVLDSHEIPF